MSLYTEHITDLFEATFLNKSRILHFPTCWNDDRCEKLWLYNLHYFEDVLCSSAKEREEFILQLIYKWIEQNPPGVGIGWEPYTISLRVTNILKAWAAGLPIDDRIAQSLYQQSDFLSRNLERHLLGNHYFVNLKALMFAGVIFNNKDWINRSSAELFEQVSEQILADGMHFELSPMYHRLALVDMLDLCNLAQAFPELFPANLSDLIRSKIAPMLNAMEVMSHPDLGVSFFNDSVDGVAPSSDTIRSYAASLGYRISSCKNIALKIDDLASSGYLVAQTQDAKLIFDAALVGPDYIPGHAHADTLSFEMSIGLQRVFVNSGVSEYGVSPTRFEQRETSAHNTVQVDQRNSSEVWSSFRVAKRAKVFGRTVTVDTDKCLFSCSHLGYKSAIGGAIHKRSLAFGQKVLIVQDDLQGSWKSAISRFHFHPSLEVSVNANTLHVKGAEFNMKADLEGLDARVIETTWHPEFGKTVLNKCLVVDFTRDSCRLVFDWA